MSKSSWLRPGREARVLLTLSEATSEEGRRERGAGKRGRERRGGKTQRWRIMKKDSEGMLSKLEPEYCSTLSLSRDQQGSWN